MYGIRTVSIDLLESSTVLCMLKYFMLILQPGLVQAVMAVPIVKPGSITAIKEVGKVEAVVVTEHGDERAHRVAVAGQKFSVVRHRQPHCLDTPRHQGPPHSLVLWVSPTPALC